MARMRPQIWEASDGTPFDTEAKADEHDELIAWAARHVREVYRLRDPESLARRVRMVVEACVAREAHVLERSLGAPTNPATAPDTTTTEEH